MSIFYLINNSNKKTKTAYSPPKTISPIMIEPNRKNLDESEKAELKWTVKTMLKEFKSSKKAP